MTIVRNVESSMPGLTGGRMFATFCHASRQSLSHSWLVVPLWSFWPSLLSRFCMLLLWSLMRNQIWQIQHKLKARGLSSLQSKGLLLIFTKACLDWWTSGCVIGRGARGWYGWTTIRRSPTQSKFAIPHAESCCFKTRIPHLIALRARVLCTPLIF